MFSPRLARSSDGLVVFAQHEPRGHHRFTHATHREGMRVVIVTESFLPQVNGVTNTVCHVVDRLRATDHDVLVIAPGRGPTRYGDVHVVRVRSIGLPGYRSFALGLPDRAVHRAIADFGPDIVHLASPVALGAVGLKSARRLGVPSLAVYQTDIAGFARQYGIRVDAPLARWIAHIHGRVDRTLVPSVASYLQLAALDVPGLHVWRRGVALELFGPQRRDLVFHERFTRGHRGRLAVGYVGRLAAEKQVHRMEELAGLPGIQLVVVGDGPARSQLERRLPGAVFTGLLQGDELARAFASLDLFVHTGTAETFCQTVQEAQASGVPVVAPAVGGPRDLVEQGRTGLLYDPDDPQSLVGTVDMLRLDPALRAHLAANALREVATRGWPGVVDDLVAHYAAVLRHRNHAAA